MNTSNANPYVGLRTFQKEEGHLFFGRDRETRDLTALVASERLVLFYAQSGAGKSSLINTRVIPDLENNRYEVFPVGRVSGDVPAGLKIANVYIYNLIRSLIQHEADPKTIAGLSLSQFMVRLNKDDHGYFYDEALEVPETGAYPPGRRALIIDQFEEIFTSHPNAWDRRADFFSQLAKAMQEDPQLWVVLTMREDYIASLDPYSYLLPGRLRIRYYMQRLEGDAALKAIKGPVEKIRPYADGVAEALVKDLSRNQIKRPDGELEFIQGQYVEPIVLQVVCHGLWKSLPPSGSQITMKDREEFANVNAALENYYEDRLKTVSDVPGVSEREVREWFEEELITSGNTRNLVLSDSITSEGVKAALPALQGNLIRAEVRAGQTWYELSHDRLIEPVHNSNREWFEKHLTLFQRQAALWMKEGRGKGLLLRGQELVQAEQEAEEARRAKKLNPDEEAFLAACTGLRAEEQREQRQRRFILIGFVATLILSVVALIGAYQLNQARAEADRARIDAVNAKNEAEIAKAYAEGEKQNADKARQDAVDERTKAQRLAEEALAGSLAAQAESIKNSDHALALLLGIEAYNNKPSLLTRGELFQLLQFTPFTREFGFVGSVSSVAVSPDGRLIAVASCRTDTNNQCTRQGNISLYNEKLEKLREVSGTYGTIYSLAFHPYPDRLVLAAGGCIPQGCSESQGQITLWEITAENSVQLSQVNIHTALVKTIAFSPVTSSRTILATGSYDTTILLWDATDPARLRGIGRKLDHQSFVNSVAFSPDGSTLAVAGDDWTIYLWNVKNLDFIPVPFTSKQHRGPAEAVAFAPEELKPECAAGSVLATAGDDNLVYLWDWCPNQANLKSHFAFTPAALQGHAGYVKSLAFNSDGSYLASAGFDNRIIIWDTATGAQVGAPLGAHTNAINQVIFGSGEVSGGPFLISVSNDRTIIQWDFATFNPLSRRSNQSAILADAANLRQIEDGGSVSLSGDLELKFLIDDQRVALTDASDMKYLELPDSDSLIDEMYTDGKYLITRDQNGYFVRWSVDPADWVQQACEAANRNLAESEWNQYFPNQPYDPKHQTCEVQ